MLEVNHLSCGFGSTRVLENISVQLPPGLNIIVGPNAAGKTTFLNCIAGLKKSEGNISLDGQLLSTFNGSFNSELLSYLPQHTKNNIQLSVFETVLLGRLAKLSLKVSKTDKKIVADILEEFKISHLSNRPLAELSGGQQQLIGIAQVLVRSPRVLILDEPTNNLDLSRQLEIFEIIKKLTKEKGLVTIMALHDLNFAIRFADQLLVLQEGKIVASGLPEKIFSQSLLRDIYGIEASIFSDENNRPVIVPIRAVN